MGVLCWTKYFILLFLGLKLSNDFPCNCWCLTLKKTPLVEWHGSSGSFFLTTNIATAGFIAFNEGPTTNWVFLMGNVNN